jgi:hypothetical protein
MTHPPFRRKLEAIDFGSVVLFPATGLALLRSGGAERPAPAREAAPPLVAT